MAKLTRNLFIPCIDTSDTSTPTWTPIDLSTIFEFAFNPQEETYGYICNANDSTEVTGYAPELPQEIVLDSSNPIYAFLFDFFMGFPVGSDLNRKVLLCAPDSTGAVTKGYMWPQAVLSPTALNTVDGKLTFTLKLNGDKQDGTVAISGGNITFTA